MKKTPLFTGSATAIVTPFRDSGIDYDKMGELIDMQYKGGTAALIIAGSTGEGATTTTEEHEELIEFSVKYSAGRMKIVASVGSNNTASALHLAEFSKSCGADGILMVTPYYNKSTQKGLVTHFTTVADRVDIPMIVYDVPSRTGIQIKAETFYELSKHPNINGVKAAAGDFNEFAKARVLCGDDLFFWSGNDSDTVGLMSMGALGVISVISNMMPEMVAELCEHGLKGDFKAASDVYFKHIDLFNDLFIEVNPVPVKTAMNLMGLDVGKLRLPLIDMEPAHLEKLKASMRKSGIAV